MGYARRSSHHCTTELSPIINGFSMTEAVQMQECSEKPIRLQCPGIAVMLSVEMFRWALGSHH
jgi:hypothetical protein